MDVAAIAEAIKTRVSGGDALGATIKFDCGDDGVIFIDGNATPPSVSTDNADADCTISLDTDVMAELISGDLDPTAAFMQGKIKVDGDMGVAMKLGSIL